jgi:hypothetical protein
MWCILIHLGMDRDGSITQVPGAAQYPAGNLSPVGNQDAVEIFLQVISHALILLNSPTVAYAFQ